MSPKSRRSGGPQTAVGKAKASQNAMKHGLSVTRPVTATEKEMTENFARELINFYEPQSPLEKLQIERIALCRAKLARLYAVENARLEMEINKLAHAPSLFFDKMPHVRGLVKGMALEFVRFGSVTLPFGLTESELLQIVNEIRSWQGRSIDETMLWKSAPCLTSLVDRERHANHKDNPEITRLEQLQHLLKSLEQIIADGERYAEHVKAIYAVYEYVLREDEDVGDPIVDELLEMIKEQNQRLFEAREKRHGKSKPAPVSADEEKQHTQKAVQSVIKKCQALVQLYFESQEAKRVYAQFTQTRSLALEAVGLPTAEADLMLRYQTTWERRLSSAIGELLELQRRR